MRHFHWVHDIYKYSHESHVFLHSLRFWHILQILHRNSLTKSCIIHSFIIELILWLLCWYLCIFLPYIIELLWCYCHWSSDRVTIRVIQFAARPYKLSVPIACNHPLFNNKSIAATQFACTCIYWRNEKLMCCLQHVLTNFWHTLYTGIPREWNYN